MKKVLLAVVILVGLSTVANAQTSKGTWLLGGGASFTSQSEGGQSYSDWSISPSIGGFIKNNLAIGALLDINGYDGGTSTNINAYVKPYFGGSETNKWFAIGTIGSISGGGDTNLKYGIGLGNATFLNKSVALEVSANYSQLNTVVSSSEFALKVGFQIHFGGK